MPANQVNSVDANGRIPLNDGTVQRIACKPNLHLWRNQYIGGPRRWNLDASLFKRFRLWEGGGRRRLAAETDAAQSYFS